MSNRHILDSLRLWFTRTEPSAGQSVVARSSNGDVAALDVPARFRVAELLGKGGMGRVYRAFDSELGREVALKCLNELSPLETFHLKQEFRSLVNVVHPNLVELYELVADDRRCFFTMELVSGPDFCFHVQSLLAARGKTNDVFEELTELSHQLVLGIGAVHAARKLHRDIKPSNTLVTQAGRVVLLDFGLVVQDESGSVGSRSMAGTPEYMAPEQAFGEPVTPASDWYALGVTLYEAIAGVLPYEGPFHQLLRRKRDKEYQPLRQHVPELPVHFERLIDGLLEPDPAKRPRETELLAFFRGQPYPAQTRSAPPHVPQQAESQQFVDRDAERSRLAELLDEPRATERVIHVTGSSGIGKSELIRQVLRKVAARPEHLLLRARCHPQESVTFNAFDGVVDDLAEFLGRVGRDEAAAYLPDDTGALLRVFPVIGSAGGFPEQPPERQDVGADLRRNGARALKQMLRRICERRRVTMWIDDMQWGDVDSGLLLEELLRPPDMPPALVIVSYRSDDRANSACLNALAGLDEMLDRAREELALRPLSREHSRELVRRWAGLPVELPESAYDLAAADAGGLPFMLCEVGQHLSTNPDDPVRRALPLAEILEAKLQDLPQEALDVIEICAVAGEPLHLNTILDAAGTRDGRPLLLRLEKLRVLRTTSVSEGTAQLYHDRLRAEFLSRMSEESVRARHGSLARALVRAGSSQLSAIVDHFLAADDRESAKRYVLPAARAADSAFAFQQAVRLYQRAIELDCNDVDRAELVTRLAQALMNAGHALDAARAFQRAADLVEARPVSDREHVQHLRQRAAEQFLQCGYVAEAVVLLDALLADLGIELPATRAQALTRATLRRARQMAGSVEPPSRGAFDVKARIRAEALWAVTLRLGMIDHARMSFFSAVCLDEARRSNDTSAMARAYALDAAFTGLVPVPYCQRRADRMMQAASKLCQASASLHDHAHVAWGFGALCWMRGQWSEAARHFDESVAHLRRSRSKLTFDLALLDLWRLATLAHLGEIPRLRERMLEIRDEANQLDDRYIGRVHRLGQQTLSWLAEDRAEYALELAQEASRWLPEEYSTGHFHHLVATAQALIYLDRGLEAWQLCSGEWPRVRSSFLLTCAGARDELHQLRGRCALAAADELRRGAAAPAGVTIATLCRDARDRARLIKRHGMACADGWSALLMAGADSLEGLRANLAGELRVAAADFERNRMVLYAAAAERALAEVEGLDEARAERADDRLRAQEVKNPQRMARLLAPGCFKPSIS